MRTLLSCMLLAATPALFTSSATAEDPTMVDAIGPTPIRFYSGNLSVAEFMRYWGTRQDDQYDGAGPDNIPVLQRTSCVAMCDYLPWCLVEQEEGVWDFSFFENNARLLREADILYNVFCWIHFPPRWYLESDRFVPYQELGTGNSIPQISLWSPDLERVADTFYARLAEHLGDEIAFVRLAMPSEYGEVGYCARLTHWLVPQENAREGWWCGDPHAQADFRQRMLVKHGSLYALNRAWGTDFASEEAVEMPDQAAIVPQFSESAAARRRWVDFVDWYQESWVRSLEQFTAIVQKHFPGKEIIGSIGYGREQPRLGNDEGRHIAAMGRLGIACQSPGDIGYLPTRRNSSASRFYGVPYFTEPPGDVPPDRQLDRIYMDIANGVETWFDYPQNMDRAKDLFRKYKRHMMGAPPRTTMAVWHPTLDHWLHPDDPWSMHMVRLSEFLRDAAAYEILDDRMIADGALDAMGVRQLVLCGADWLDADAWRAVHAWVRRGGVLLVASSGPMADIEGDDALWHAQAPEGIPDAAAYASLDVPEPPSAYVLDPCAPGDTQDYMTGVWHDMEQPRWVAPGGGFMVPVRPGSTYRVTVSAHLPPQAAPVDVEINGKIVLALDAPLSEPVSFDWTAPEESTGPHIARMTFTGTGWVPSEAGASPDNRRLGLYVERVEVRETGHAGAPDPVPAATGTLDLDALWVAAAVRLGDGAVVTFNPANVTHSMTARALAGLWETAGDRIGRPEWNAPHIDAGQDGILSVQFDDRILYFNPMGEDRRIELEYREGDFPPGTPRPSSMHLTLDVPARTIKDVPLAAAPPTRP